MAINKFLSLLIFTLLAGSILLVASQQQEDLSFLAGKSFEVTTKITKIVPTSNRYNVYQVNEKYSWSQRRARIEIKAENRAYESRQEEASKGFEFQWTTYYVDTSRANVVINLDKLLNKCQSSSLDNLYANLELSSINNFKVGDAPGPNNGTHIVGSVQLLSFVSRNRNKLQFSSQRKIKNIHLDSYILKVDDVGMFFVYYNRKDDINDPHTLPTKVTYLISNKMDLSYDFSPIKLLELDSHKLNLKQQVDKVMLDDFVFPSLSGCSRASVISGGENLLADQRSPVKFSFKAEVSHRRLQRVNSRQLTLANYKTFVAYDESLHSMRVDTFESDLATSPTRLMYNFETNKLYSLPPKQRDSSNESPECVVAKVKGTYNVSVKVKLGQLLTGAEDSFVYLGRGQVRGISALVYEVVHSKLPFWLDPEPADENESMRHDSRREQQVGDTTNTILYYFGERETNQPLLMMQIYQHDKEDHKRVHSHQMIEIFEFKWHLESIAPTIGDRPSEMFSLADLCADTQLPSSQVELVLEQETPELSEEATDWLSTASLRNQVVLVGIHETLKLSAANVFNLETRVARSIRDQKSTIYVAFKHASHRSQVTKIAYVAHGDVHPSFRDNVRSFNVHSFRDCFLLASRTQNNVHIAFNRKDSLCLIDDQRRNGSSFETNPNSFMLGGELEIFKVYLEGASEGDFMAYWTKVEKAAERAKMQGKEIKLGFREPLDQRATFRIKRVHLKDNNLVPNEENEYSKPLANIPGYGLGLDDFEFNKLLDSIEVDSKIVNPLAPDTGEEETHEFEMTPSHCHAKCLTDPDCQSYSLCTINYKVQCILSTMSFKSPQILRELKASTKTKSGHHISVSVHEKQTNKTYKVSLIKRPACTVYNKQYLDLFRLGQSKSNCPLSMVNVNGVRSSEECAAQCAQKNFKLNSRFSKMSSEQMFQVSEKADVKAEVEQQTSWRQTIEDEICYSFWHITSDEVLNFPENVRSIFKSASKDEENISGYCVVSKNKAERSEIQKLPSSERNQLIEAENYHFQLASLYEETRGVALMPTELNAKELLTLERVKIARSVSKEEVDQMRSMAERGENFQEYSIYSDTDRCAELCFMQRSNPWPACRSFDVIVERIKDYSTVRCRFNSVTLKQVMASGKDHLIENQTDATYELRHYEPRLGLLMDSFALANELESSLMAQRLSSGHFHLLFVVLLAMAAGLWVGVVIHRKWLSGCNLANSTRLRTNSTTELVLENNHNHELTGE